MKNNPVFLSGPVPHVPPQLGSTAPSLRGFPFRWSSLGIAPDPSVPRHWTEMVILLDSSIAAHRAQHKDVETDFFFYQFCIFLIRLSWMAFAEVQTMPSSAGREEDEGISRHFQDG